MTRKGKPETGRILTFSDGFRPTMGREEESLRHFIVPDLSRVHADNGGLGVFHPGWSHPGRRLTSSVLLFGAKGTVELVVDGEPMVLIPGRVAVLPAGLTHAGNRRLVESASYFWFHFTLPDDLELLSQDEADTILSNEGVTLQWLGDGALLPLQFDLPEPEPFHSACRDLLNQQESPTYTPRKFQLLFQQLLIALTEAVIASHQPPTVVSPTSSVVYAVLGAIAENLTDPNLSVKSVAQALGLNLDYVGKRFKSVMGISVGDYVLAERLKLATARLEQTTDTVEAVAAGCGFGTLRHFLRQFKGTTGLTPTQVRVRYRMMHINSL